MNETSKDWRIGKVLDNRYQIKDVVGVGGMAVVYKAFDNKLKRNLAIKVLQDDIAMDSESRRRFRTEYQAVALLSHPNIRAVYDVVSSGDTEYIVMEYVDGINLKQYLNKKNGPLSWKQAVHFSSQIAKALSHAHSKGIIHMDIKPQNIMLPKDGTAKVADFGIALLENSQDSSDSDEAVGSIHYISPEQARGETVDARTDIYSLGVVMYEMLTGVLPFKGENVEDVAKAMISTIPDEPFVVNPDVPDELSKITMKAMSTVKDERYQTANELLEALDKFRQSVSFNEYISEIDSGSLSDPKSEQLYIIKKGVPRISKSGELSREAYIRRRTRSQKISLLLGMGIALAFCIFLFSFVWNYWLYDIFKDVERISVADFTGLYADDLKADESLNSIYDFTYYYTASEDVPVGAVASQSPASGTSRATEVDGIPVSLYISSGIELATIPDVVGDYYADVQQVLKDAGLNIMVDWVASDEYIQDIVTDISPAVGASVPVGTYVTISVSAGPEANSVTMPDLHGVSKDSALAILSENGLICTENEITYVTSQDSQIDIVLWQNQEAGEEVVAGTTIYLQIGKGEMESEDESE